MDITQVVELLLQILEFILSLLPKLQGALAALQK